MSLPVYEAIGFQYILEKGGHSKPWVVMVNVKGSPKPYVVKLYKTADIEARNKMTAEVLGNVMTRDFNLKTPEAAIIKFSDDFRMTLKQNCEDLLVNLDERPKFGSFLIEGANTFNLDTNRREVRNVIEPALLYAYDYFICNRDRTINKPNLIVKNGEGYLIDHEMALEIEAGHFDFDQTLAMDNRYKNHLFYNFLKTQRGDKMHIFDEFELYLNSLNLKKYDSYFLQLEQMGFNTQKEWILEYWEKIRVKSTIFVNILTNSIL
jgi:hypothetical protein